MPCPAAPQMHPSRCSTEDSRIMRLDLEQSLLLVIDVQERLMPVIHHGDDIIRRCDWLLRLARKLSVKTLATVQYPAGLGPLVSPLTQYFSEATTYSKMSFSAFTDPAIRESVLGFSKNQIVVVGVEAHVCVLQTVLDLLSHGLDVFVLDDAIGSRRSSDKMLATQRMRDAGACFVSAEMILFEWLDSAAHPEFKSISKSFIEPV